MHAGACGQRSVHQWPVGRNEILLHLFRLRRDGILARILPQHRTVRAQHFQRDVLCRGRQIVVDQRPVRWILTHRLIRRHRRIGVLHAAHAPRIGRLEEHRHLLTRLRGYLAQRSNVVEDPERPAVRRYDQIITLHQHIAHRRVRQVVLDRPPVPAIVQRNPHRFLGRCIQQPRLHRVGAHRVHRRIIRQTRADRLPRLAAVVCAERVRLHVVDAHTVHRHIRRVIVETRCVDLRNFAPCCQPRRRDVRPVRSAVAGDPDQTVIRSRPDRLHIFERSRDRVDHATSLVLQIGGQRRQRLRLPALFLAQVRADRLPGVPIVGCFEEMVGRVIHRVRIDRGKRIGSVRSARKSFFRMGSGVTFCTSPVTLL